MSAATVFAQALSFVEQTGECWSAAELWRIKGGLLLWPRHPQTARAEECLQRALAIAARQRARWWQLRSATSLARLWHGQGKWQAAIDLLAPVYNWFTEGFDTTDIHAAQTLLNKLIYGHPEPAIPLTEQRRFAFY
jgi:predicted ATPase